MDWFRIDDMRLTDLKVGDRVELHPATDLWMRGARFGEVVKLGRTKVHVAIDRLNGRTLAMSPASIGAVGR